MTFFTPAFLLFVPLWATHFVMKSTLNQNFAPAEARATHDDDGDDPQHWIAMPFTPPSVHAA